MDEHLARAGGDEILHGRVDRLRVAIPALDAVRPEKAAEKLGLVLSRNDGQDDWFVGFHRVDATR